MSKKRDLKDKIRELQLRRLYGVQVRQRTTGEVPAKKKSKPVGYKMQNTFDANLRGVPGGSRWRVGSEIRMVSADRTGCKVRKEPIGVLRSARNANTTQGSYITTVIPGETDMQGRKVFGR